MNYCYYCQRLPWPSPSPFPLGLTIKSSLSATFPRSLKSFPWLPQPYWKPRTRAQSLRGEWSWELLATCSPVLQVLSPTNTMDDRAKIPPTPQNWTFLILRQIFNSFLTFQNSPSPEISSWTGYCLLKQTIRNDRVSIRAIASHQRSFWRTFLKVCPPPFFQSNQCPIF